MDNTLSRKCCRPLIGCCQQPRAARGHNQYNTLIEEATMPIAIDESTKRCTLIADDLNIEGEAGEVQITTDADLRMSIATLAGQRVPITEQEADALTVAGAVDGRRHLKTTEQGSII